MSKVTLKHIAQRKLVDMGQCMCVVKCTRKVPGNKALTNQVAKVYRTPKLSDLSKKNMIDMGQCLCVVKCTRKVPDNKALTSQVAKVYAKTLRKAA